MASQSLSAERAVTPAMDAPRLAFDDVYRGHVRFVWRVLRYLGVPAESVEDAVQDVFVVVHRRHRQFVGGDVRAWLYGIARGVARNHVRSAFRAARRRAQVPVPAVPVDPDEAIVHGELLQRALAMLAGVDEDKRIVFLLMDVEGLSAPEVSSLLGVNVNTVYARRRAARQQFEERIRDGG